MREIGMNMGVDGLLSIAETVTIFRMPGIFLQRKGTDTAKTVRIPVRFFINYLKIK